MIHQICFTSLVYRCFVRFLPLLPQFPLSLLDKAKLWTAVAYTSNIGRCWLPIPTSTLSCVFYNFKIDIRFFYSFASIQLVECGLCLVRSFAVVEHSSNRYVRGERNDKRHSTAAQISFILHTHHLFVSLSLSLLSNLFGLNCVSVSVYLCSIQQFIHSIYRVRYSIPYNDPYLSSPIENGFILNWMACVCVCVYSNWEIQYTICCYSKRKIINKDSILKSPAYLSLHREKEKKRVSILWFSAATEINTSNTVIVIETKRMSSPRFVCRMYAEVVNYFIKRSTEPFCYIFLSP